MRIFWRLLSNYSTQICVIAVWWGISWERKTSYLQNHPKTVLLIIHPTFSHRLSKINGTHSQIWHNWWLIRKPYFYLLTDFPTHLWKNIFSEQNASAKNLHRVDRQLWGARNRVGKRNFETISNVTKVINCVTRVGNCVTKVVNCVINIDHLWTVNIYVTHQRYMYQAHRILTSVSCVT